MCWSTIGYGLVANVCATAATGAAEREAPLMLLGAGAWSARRSHCLYILRHARGEGGRAHPCDNTGDVEIFVSADRAALGQDPDVYRSGLQRGPLANNY